MPRGLSGMTVAELNAEIRRRQRSAKTLERRRAKLMVKVNNLDDQIRALGGKLGGAAGNGRTRPKNDTTLSEALAKLLKGKSMSVVDAAAAVQKAGYRTSSSNFRTQVNIALIKGPFKRTGRGMYAAK